MRIHFYASDNPRPQAALKELKASVEDAPIEDADVIVVLGGDGTMLRALHQFTGTDKPLFGMNLGTLGFLLNEYKPNDLQKRIENAKSYDIHPLKMHVEDIHGNVHDKIAYNEVSLIRETHSSAKIMVFVNDEVRMPLLVCDGIMVSTPVGSTAYNSSADGPILPLSANVLPITPISAFRPRRWPGALIPDTSSVRFEIIRPDERPVSASADSFEVRDIASVSVSQATDITAKLLFGAGNHLEERIYQEQFTM